MSKEVKMQAKLVHNEKFLDGGEYYCIYLKRSDEPDSEWGLDTAYRVTDGKISAELANHLQELLYMGYEILWKGRE